MKRKKGHKQTFKFKLICLSMLLFLRSIFTSTKFLIIYKERHVFLTHSNGLTNSFKNAAVFT